MSAWDKPNKNKFSQSADSRRRVRVKPPNKQWLGFRLEDHRPSESNLGLVGLVQVVLMKMSLTCWPRNGYYVVTTRRLFKIVNVDWQFKLLYVLLCQWLSIDYSSPDSEVLRTLGIMDLLMAPSLPEDHFKFLDLIVEFATAPHLLRICVFIVARGKSIEHVHDGYDKNRI